MQSQCVKETPAIVTTNILQVLSELMEREFQKSGNRVMPVNLFVLEGKPEQG